MTQGAVPSSGGLAVPHQHRRHCGPVRRRERAALDDVLRRVEPRRVPALHLSRRPRKQIDRRPHGRTEVALVAHGHRGRVIGRVARQLEATHLVAARQHPAGARQVVVRDDAQPMLVLGAVGQHDRGRERVDPQQPLVRVLGARFGPRAVVLVVVAGDRRRHHAELDRVVVGDDQ